MSSENPFKRWVTGAVAALSVAGAAEPVQAGGRDRQVVGAILGGVLQGAQQRNQQDRCEAGVRNYADPAMDNAIQRAQFDKQEIDLNARQEQLALDTRTDLSPSQVALARQRIEERRQRARFEVDANLRTMAAGFDQQLANCKPYGW